MDSLLHQYLYLKDTPTGGQCCIIFGEWRFQIGERRMESGDNLPARTKVFPIILQCVDIDTGLRKWNGDGSLTVKLYDPFCARIPPDTRSSGKRDRLKQAGTPTVLLSSAAAIRFCGSLQTAIS